MPTIFKNPQNKRHSPTPKKEKGEWFFRIHPLFLAFGFWYALQGDFFLFLMSALVALQHELAHAFAASRLGYKLNKIVLLPFGAVIDGDLQGIGFKEEILVAVCGPIANLLTAIFFASLWWFEPTMYAFTDTAFYSSLSVALVNLLPTYPLDGGRILRCALARFFTKRDLNGLSAERKAERICFFLTLSFALFFLFLFLLFLLGKKGFHLSLLAFALFLLVGALGNKKDKAAYVKIDFSKRNALKKGVEIKRVAILSSCTVKNAVRFLQRDGYLVLEVYDEAETLLFTLTQNELAELFSLSNSPYDDLGTLYSRWKACSQKKSR
ncbi:MAG: site-2 protease family protein [Clostridia bacterium]|nr:site-2 protease family protein [Clostridia bacterium]